MNAPTPGLNPLAAGLRTVHYDARTAGKVNLIVQPGDTLIVSDDVADQLVAGSAQFKDLAAPSTTSTNTAHLEVTVSPAADAADEEPAPAESVKRTRKRAAKTKD